VRQPGSVAQRSLDVRLIRGARHATFATSLAGNVKADAATIESAVAVLRTALPELADDPHLLLPDDVVSTRVVHSASLPPTENVVAEVLEAARGFDLVGLLAAGPVYRGFANSFGKRNWHEAISFNLQWSLYHHADKAVKSGLSGFRWDGTPSRNGCAHAIAPVERRPVARAGRIARTCHRARWRRSPACCAGADSPAARLPPSRARSDDCRRASGSIPEFISPKTLSPVSRRHSRPKASRVPIACR
jgi:hypothetical protein